MLTVLVYTVKVILELFLLCMFVGAIMSWFPATRGSSFYRILNAVTEPIVAPVRALLMKIEFFRTFPIDFSYLIVFILISFISQRL